MLIVGKGENADVTRCLHAFLNQTNAEQGPFQGHVRGPRTVKEGGWLGEPAVQHEPRAQRVARSLHSSHPVGVPPVKHCQPVEFGLHQRHLEAQCFLSCQTRLVTTERQTDVQKTCDVALNTRQKHNMDKPTSGCQNQWHSLRLFAARRCFPWWSVEHAISSPWAGRGSRAHHGLELKPPGGVEGTPEVQHVRLEDECFPTSEAAPVPLCQRQHKCPRPMRTICMQLLQSI